MGERGSMVASPPTERVRRLRERIVNAPQEVCVERARYVTESMREHWEEHPLTRMSKALEHILENITVTIREGELIVGCRTSKLKGAPLFPENKTRWLEGDVENFDRRVLQRALITPEEKRELLEDILPFWRGRTVEERFMSLVPPDVAEDMDKYIFTIMLEITYGIGHFTMDHPTLLRLGMGGIMAEARRRLEELPEEQRKGEKGLFYEAVIGSLGAAVGFARRHADLARRMAEEEKDPRRAAELKEIARICERVPEHPAETFHEALQSVYFAHLIAQIESGGNSISLGRIDQYLYPYYRKDLEEGRITPERARELLSLLYIKTCEIWNVLEEAFIPGGEGPEGKTTQNLTIGGMGSDGEDAVNELSYLALDAFADVRTVQPNVSLRMGSRTPRDFFLRAVRYARDGVPLHFFNDDAVVPMLARAGHSLEDARDYALVGCVEPNAQGKTFGSTFAVQFNGIKCVEFALSNGVDNIFGLKSGLETGDPASFTSFDQVWEAFRSQMSHFLGQMVKGMQALDTAIAEMLPSPFASAMIRGPLEKGMDLTRGGAVYNSTGVQLMGFSNTADSLYAVKKAVFEEGRFSLQELAEWLATDWMDAEEQRKYLLLKVPKYGNDLDGPDEMAARVLDLFCDLLEGYTNYRGGAFWPGVFSVGFHLAMGSFTGATPDGRYAGDPLGNGLTPSNGCATAGPTAVMNSVTRLPLGRLYNGANLNMRFPGTRTDPEKLMDLIRGYFERGGLQVQFNTVDTETLRRAQAEPDKYRDLVVRISGYSVVFVNLSDTAQEEIISRYEYQV